MCSNRLILFLLAFCLVACAPRSVREARNVVALADSCWQTFLPYADSACLADACHTLDRWQWACPDDYAHACYHYGRLLREKENPVAAMECFIHATHSRSRDYHILGRVYSNMGSICHLANEFQLAYDMYEKSAEMFLRKGDSTRYYYALNDLAYELAEQGKKEETLAILNNISTNINDANVNIKILETKAVLYREISQYDSTIFYAQKVLDIYCSNATMLLATAQAYYFLAQYDSALLYANKVILSSDYYGDIYNALYIISHEDSTLTKSEILQLTSKREDIRFEEYEPRKEQLSKAVHLLELNRVRKFDVRWLYTLIAVILFLCSSLVFINMWRKRKFHEKISKEIEIKQNQIDTLSQRQEEHHRQLIEEIETICTNLSESENWKKELCWNNYSKMCENVNLRLYGFVTCLLPFCLSEKEVRLCILILLKASTEQLVNNIPYAKSGLGKFKLTTARKLGTTTREMRTFLLNLLS